MTTDRISAQVDRYGASHVDHILVRNEAARLRAQVLLRMIRGTSAVVRGVASRVATRYKRRRLSEELNGLSDYVLEDLGMNRANLWAAVNRSYPYSSPSVATLVRSVVSRVAIWYKRQRLFEELEGMSDYVLADMGISRDNLRATVKSSYPYPSLAAAANDDLASRKAAA